MTTWRASSRCANSIWANRSDLTVAFADRNDLCWGAVNGYDHHARAPMNATVKFRAYMWTGGVMHLQFASWRRLTAKHAFYKMMERLKYPERAVYQIDNLYSMALDERDLALAPAPTDWWDAHGEEMKHIELDAEPWQEAEVRRLWELHGAEAFNGLNLFGVADKVAA